MRHVGFILGLVLCTASAARAQSPIAFPIADVLDLARQPYLDRGGFGRALLSALPGLNVERDTLDPAVLDPFLWSMTGSFGPNEGRAVPGAILTCARYGLSTRTYFAEQGFSTRESFELMGQVIPQPDDSDIWPDGAVARLFCSFVWDDERVVLILPQAPAQAALSAVFDQVEARPTSGSMFGEDGFSFEASAGSSDSVVHMDSATVILTQGHQSVTVRSFLMGGGA